MGHIHARQRVKRGRNLIKEAYANSESGLNSRLRGREACFARGMS